jgi:hypothetical protein
MSSAGAAVEIRRARSLRVQSLIALPLPVAAVGAFLFFARRCSAPASALGAIAFAVSGPIVSSLDFPNLSWSVAGLPWVLWAVDRAAADTRPRAIATLALTVALQALAGEPVTLGASLALASLYGLIAAPPTVDVPTPTVARRVIALGAGLALGLMLAAIQLIPMQRAAALSERSTVILSESWSMHPLAILETVCFHLYGDFFTIPTMSAAPWMPLVNSGREPFFFSIYYGVPLLALALFGLLAPGRRRWAWFWVGRHRIAALRLRQVHADLSISAAAPAAARIVRFGEIPRRPLMSIAAAAAAGWDALASETTGSLHHSRIGAVAFAAVVGACAFVVAAGCLYFTTPAAFRFYAVAKWLGAPDPVEAAAFMLRTITPGAIVVLLLSIAEAAAIAAATSAGRRRSRRATRSIS